MKNKKKDWFRILFFLFVLLLLAFLAFSKYGLIDYLKTRSELNGLKKELIEKRKLLKNMEAKIDSLKTNLKVIEKIARKKYKMHKPNEQVIKIEKVK